jgi:hypothetical protein
MVRVALAVAAAAAVILSAPFVQQGFTAAYTFFPSIGVVATALPIAVAVLVAAARIRHQRPLRFTALALSVAIGAAYVRLNALTPTESFHFVEYGLLGCLFYLALLPADDWSVLVLPLVAGIATGILDEWFQWFIPIRAGEVRDIALDAVATLCGVVFAVSLRPPPRLALRLGRRSTTRIALSATAALALFACFLFIVHVGYEVRDPEIGTFVSRFTAAQLAALAKERGDIAAAWRENLILEKFFVPVLDAQTYAGATGQRWPAEQRAEAAFRPGVDRRPLSSTDYRWPLHVLRSK